MWIEMPGSSKAIQVSGSGPAEGLPTPSFDELGEAHSRRMWISHHANTTDALRGEQAFLDVDVAVVFKEPSNPTEHRAVRGAEVHVGVVEARP